MTARTLGRIDRFGRTHEGETMIDWDSDTWGGGVTYAADGSWLGDKQAAHTQARRQSTKDDD